MMTSSPAAELLAEIRKQGPLVHSITNNVVTIFTANVLLAIGAAPAMVDIVGESGMFAQVANGMLINLGTPTPEQREASIEAVNGANEAGTPWVLDPVAIGALPIRTELAKKLADMKPTAIRGNASEIRALAGAGAGGRGVDSTDAIDDGVEEFTRLAREKDTVVAVSGPEDFITDGTRILRVKNGDVLLTKVTGGGCALGSIIAAFIAVRGEVSILEAVASAHVVYGVAAERAAAGGVGPGTFAVKLLDALYEIRPADITENERVYEETIAGVAK